MCCRRRRGNYAGSNLVTVTPWARLDMSSFQNMQNDGDVATWTDSSGSATPHDAKGYSIGGASLPKLKVGVEGYPFVRLGNGTPSVTVGNYFDFGPQSFKLGTNGGFTVVANVRFTAVSTYTRIIDFGNGSPDKNIILARNGTTSTLVGDTYVPPVFRVSSGTSGITGDWQVVAYRVSKTDGTIVTDGSTLVKVTQSNALADVTFKNAYIGRSWWSEPTANIDLRELTIFDKALTDAELTSYCAEVRDKYRPWARLHVDSLLNLKNDEQITTWTDSSASAHDAKGYAVGGATLPKLKVGVEGYPFVQLGTGTPSVTVGNYFDFGAQSFKLGTNGGFTVVANVRFTAASTFARIIDFGNGAPDNNIILARNGTTSTLVGDTYVSSTASRASSGTSGGITNDWQVVAYRVSKTDGTIVTDFSGTAKTTWPTPIALADVTFKNTYIGKSWWSSTEPSSNLDIRALAIFDRPLSDVEILSHISEMKNRSPSRPWARLEVSSLAATLKDGDGVTEWKDSSPSGHNATGYAVGTAPRPTLKVATATEKYPFVRFGAEAISTTAGNYFDFGPQLFKLATNGGFTVVTSIKFRANLLSDFQRIIDFGSGSPDRNIIFARLAATNSLCGNIYVPAVQSLSTDALKGIKADTWQVMAFRATPTESTIVTDTYGMVKAPKANTVTDVTFKNMFIGRSWWNEPYSTFDMRELIIFEKALTDSELLGYVAELQAKYA